jgi:hypothetical protein
LLKVSRLVGAPLADFRYFDALVIRASYLRDGKSLAQEQARMIHGGLPRADLARNQVAFVNLISIMNDPCHWFQAAADHSPGWLRIYDAGVVPLQRSRPGRSHECRAGLPALLSYRLQFTVPISFGRDADPS